MWTYVFICVYVCVRIHSLWAHGKWAYLDIGYLFQCL